MSLIIQIIFFVIAALIVGSALMVVTVRNLIHGALWLITSFFSVGILYLLMEAEFLAISQVLIYVGAISVLVLFAIMVTRQVTGEGGQQLFYDRWWIAAVVAALLFAAILAPTLANQPWTTVAEQPPAGIAGARELGAAFMQEYLIPFEVAAMLLLVALVGAIVVAYEERSRRRRILTLAEQWQLQQQQALNGNGTAAAASNGREQVAASQVHNE